MNPAALLSGAGEHVAQRGPRAERAVAGHELRLVQPAVAQIAEHRRPRVLALAVAVLDREQLLLAVLADADHDQQAQLGILAEPDADVDAVDEQVGVAVEPQLPGAERGVLGLPLLGQPLDRARRQPRGVLAEQISERRPEVAGREPVQVQDRQHLGHLRRPPRVRRQDPRAEPLALPGLLVDALVVHPRRPDRDRPRPDRHACAPAHGRCGRPAACRPRRPRPRTTPTYSSTSASSAAAIIRRAPSRARSSSVTATLVVLPDGEPANIRHGVPSFPAIAGGRSSSTGKVRRLPLHTHPQLLGIAREAVLRRRLLAARVPGCRSRTGLAGPCVGSLLAQSARAFKTWPPVTVDRRIGEVVRSAIRRSAG